MTQSNQSLSRRYNWFQPYFGKDNDNLYMSHKYCE